MLEAVGPTGGPPRVERQGGVDTGRRLASVPAAGAYEIPGQPPPDLLAELDRAAAVMQELAAHQINLKFDVDGASGRVRVKVIDGTGALIREIGAGHMLDVLSSGSASGLTVNAVG